jgi:trans-2,3-dihydro-3-hydroxyanthranilate isomerase
MEIEFHTVDVFTGHAFAGNQVAVLPDATGLTEGQMQAIAAEFGYSETAFVLPPVSRCSLARVRVFTPRGEVPFAGQPSIGTAFVLGRLRGAHGRPAGLRMVLEVAAGPVLAELTREGAMLIGASVRAPRPLEIGREFALPEIALCAGIAPGDISTAHHTPILISVGVPFVIAELGDAAALKRAHPRAEAFMAHLPPSLAKGLHLYVRDLGDDDAMSLVARTFAPLHGIDEDAATGSANAALAGLLAALAPSRSHKAALSITVAQGGASGRPGTVEAMAERVNGAPTGVQAWVKGSCVPVMRGHLRVPGS